MEYKHGIDTEKLKNITIKEEDIVKYSYMKDLMLLYDLDSFEISYIIKRDYGENYRSLSYRLLREWLRAHSDLTLQEMMEFLVGRSIQGVRNAAHQLGISFRKNYSKKIELGTHTLRADQVNNKINKFLEDNALPFLSIKFYALNHCLHKNMAGVNTEHRLKIFCKDCRRTLARAEASKNGKITPSDVNRLTQEVRARLKRSKLNH